MIHLGIHLFLEGSRVCWRTYLKNQHDEDKGALKTCKHEAKGNAQQDGTTTMLHRILSKVGFLPGALCQASSNQMFAVSFGKL